MEKDITPQFNMATKIFSEKGKAIKDIVSGCNTGTELMALVAILGFFAAKCAIDKGMNVEFNPFTGEFKATFQ